jgi:hypothetical protein
VGDQRRLGRVDLLTQAAQAELACVKRFHDFRIELEAGAEIDLLGRSFVIASSASATAKIRALSGISVPARPSG